MFRTILSYLVYTWGGLHRYFGNLNRMRSEHEAAVRYFSRAYRLDPSFRQARLARAVLLWRELGRSDEALKELNVLLSEDEVYGPALFNRAMVMQEHGRFQHALEDLNAYMALGDEEYMDEAQRMLPILHEIVTEQKEL